jgi:hypothetical protein
MTAALFHCSSLPTPRRTEWLPWRRRWVARVRRSVRIVATGGTNRVGGPSPSAVARGGESIVVRRPTKHTAPSCPGAETTFLCYAKWWRS